MNELEEYPECPRCHERHRVFTYTIVDDDHDCEKEGCEENV